MIKLHKLIASVFGLGFLKGGGTWASLVCCMGWISLPADYLTVNLQVFFIVIITIQGIWSSNIVDAVWGKDSSKVVIDELAGMMITLFFIPVQPKYVFIGLVFFRVFDITKPFYIRSIEKYPRGWGVMGDDILAGIYANILLQTIVHFGI